MFAVCVAALLLSANVASADYMYRYINDAGTTVIDHSIPPEFVKNGYEILNQDGSVHEVVPRELTAQEMAERSSDEYRKQVEAEEAKRLEEWDNSLLLRYSSVEDISAARDRALSELKIRISILKSNARQLTRQVESNQARAADIERSGGTVPVEIVSTIGSLQDEVVETERAVLEREREMKLISRGFQRDMDRFEHLLDKVELRKRHARRSN